MTSGAAVLPRAACAPHGAPGRSSRVSPGLLPDMMRARRRPSAFPDRIRHRAFFAARPCMQAAGLASPGTVADPGAGLFAAVAGAVGARPLSPGLFRGGRPPGVSPAPSRVSPGRAVWRDRRRGKAPLLKPSIKVLACNRDFPAKYQKISKVCRKHTNIAI